MATTTAMTAKMTEEELLNHYHQRFSNYHTVQLTKDTLATAVREAKKSSEACARVVTAKQNARNAGVCIDMAKQMDAFKARVARLQAKLAKKQGK